MSKHYFFGNRHIAILATILVWLALVLQIYFIHKLNVNQEASFFIYLFSFITAALLLVRRWSEKALSFRITALFTTFTLIVAWRLSVLANLPIVSYVYLAALILKLINFFITAYHDIRDSKLEPSPLRHHNTCFEWQLTFIRMFIGYDLIPHFCEKLFAGASVRALDVNAFTSLGVPNPLYFVLLAGVIEFGGALALSCGILTRLGAIALFIYLMVATMMGHHFSLGFIWASPGGGWEFPVLWSVLILSYCIFGANSYSFDGFFKEHYQLPKWIKYLMGGRI